MNEITRFTEFLPSDPSKDFAEDPKRQKVLAPTGDGKLPGGKFSVAGSLTVGSGIHSLISYKDDAVPESNIKRSAVGPYAAIPPGGGAKPGDTWGYISSSGNKILVDSTPGSETISIVHHTGATIMIDGDGSIHLIPTGRKGLHMNAGKGDAALGASGRVIIKGSSTVSIESEGDININAGKNLGINVRGDMNIHVAGGTQLHSTGTVSLEAVKDFNSIIGGIQRTTVAGDSRIQVTGYLRSDVGKDVDVRAKMGIALQSQKGINLSSKEDSFFDGEGKLNISSSGDVNISSAKALYIASKDDVSISAADALALRAGGNIIQSAKGSMYFDSSNAFKARATDTSLHGTTSVDIKSADVGIHGTSTVKIFGAISEIHGSPVEIRGSPIKLNPAGSSPSSPETPTAAETTTPKTNNNPSAPRAPEFVEAKKILDEIGSLRKAPKFAENAKKIPYSWFERYKNEGGTPPAEAEAYAIKNKGAGSPMAPGLSQLIPTSGNPTYDGKKNNAVAKASPYTTATSTFNSNEKLSRRVTAGMLPGFNRIPANGAGGLSKAQIIANAKHLCYNIIDPLLDKFEGTIKLTSFWRNDSMNHRTGKAIDLRDSGRNHIKTGEIAAWVRDNLPYSKILLEVSRGRAGIHVHIEAAEVGQAGGGTVLSCFDSACNSNTPGLNINALIKNLNGTG